MMAANSDSKKQQTAENWNRWITYAEKQGVPKSYRQVPFDIIFQKVGFNFPPLVFWPFPIAALLMGIYFAAFWGVLMFFFVWRNEQKSVQEVALASLGAGMLFGITMAWLYARARRKYGLSSWAETVKRFS